MPAARASVPGTARPRLRLIMGWLMVPPPSGGLDVDGLDDVAHVARRVPPRLHRLPVPAPARRSFRECRGAGRELDRGLPRPERVLAEVAAELGRLPGLAAVARQLDLLDAMAAVEGDAAHHAGGACLELGTVGEGGDERANIEPRDRHGLVRLAARRDTGAAVIGNAICGLHPEVVEHGIDHGDLIDVLDNFWMKTA